MNADFMVLEGVEGSLARDFLGLVCSGLNQGQHIGNR